MINVNHFIIASENWKRAASEFAFTLISPFEIQNDGSKQHAFGFVPGYGSENGTIIGLISAPDFEIDKQIVAWATKNKVHYSFINIDSCLKYDAGYFQEILNDWGKNS